MRIFFTGVGGQGTLLATRLVGEAALEEGLPVVVSEIHGMAQRGGVVESAVAVGSLSSPTIADGEADILMAFEPIEALRALPKCHNRTIIIANTVPIIPFTVAAGRSTYPSMDSIRAGLETKVARVIWVNAPEMASKSGAKRGSNMVMVGVLAGIGKLPISEKSWHQGMKRVLPERIFESNRKAFRRGFDMGVRGERP